MSLGEKSLRIRIAVDTGLGRCVALSDIGRVFVGMLLAARYFSRSPPSSGGSIRTMCAGQRWTSVLPQRCGGVRIAFSSRSGNGL
jgi:hypothetical protein